MKTSIGNLRKLVQETLVDEGSKVGAHPDYLKKENVRMILQAAVVQAVADGTIVNESDLQHFFQVAPMAFDALKMVPLTAYQKLATTLSG